MPRLKIVTFVDHKGLFEETGTLIPFPLVPLYLIPLSVVGDPRYVFLFHRIGTAER